MNLYIELFGQNPPAIRIPFTTRPGTFRVVPTSPSAFHILGYMDVDNELSKEFAKLADEWHDEMDYASSPVQAAAHPSYLEIVAQGEAAIPLILVDLQKRGGEWYRGLRAIASAAGKSPPVFSEQDRRSSRKVEQGWVNWGRHHRYIP